MADILHVQAVNTGFVKLDLEILSTHFSTLNFIFDQGGGNHRIYLWSSIRLVFFLLRHIGSAKILFVRFADYYAFIMAVFARIFRKKLVVVVGGYDAVHIPEYDHGVYRSKWRSRAVRFTFRSAAVIAPNTATLIDSENTYARPRREGVRHFVPDTKARFQVVSNGFKTDFWRKLPEIDKQKIAITVATIRDEQLVALKGIDDFIETARRLPEYQFRVIGLAPEMLKKLEATRPANCLFFPRQNPEELRRHYSAAKVFALFSLTEGMPNVMCEAMLCECLPVGSAVNGIPDIIGDCGWIVHKKDRQEMRDNLKKALEADENEGLRARQRILENFPYERRERELTQLINDLLPEFG